MNNVYVLLNFFRRPAASYYYYDDGYDYEYYDNDDYYPEYVDEVGTRKKCIFSGHFR